MARDEVNELRSALERGEWRALAAPNASGLLGVALMADPSWWTPSIWRTLVQGIWDALPPPESWFLFNHWPYHAACMIYRVRYQIGRRHRPNMQRALDVLAAWPPPGCREGEWDGSDHWQYPRTAGWDPPPRPGH